MPSTKKVLQGIRVLDLSRFKSGPYCGQLLADLGAEVIRVEGPQGEEDRFMGPFSRDRKSLYLLFTGRHKKGITLNLRDPRGKDLFRELVANSDVVLHNYTPSGARALGVDYVRLKAMNPSVIAVAISGFGSNGPYSHKVCFDPIAQAISGLMALSGDPGGPPMKAGVNYIDFTAGLYAALGAVSALHHRRETGEGQEVEVALFDVAASFLESTITEYKLLGKPRPQVGNRNFLVAPCDAYRAKDGYVYIMIVGDQMWRRILKITGREDLGDNPDYATDWDRTKHREPLEAMVQEWVKDKTVDEAIKILDEARLPCARVNGIPEVARDPQLKARDMLVEIEQPGVGQVTLIGNPIKFSSTPADVAALPPDLGEHNAEVYSGLLGLSKSDLEAMRKEGVL